MWETPSIQSAAEKPMRFTGPPRINEEYVGPGQLKRILDPLSLRPVGRVYVIRIKCVWHVCICSDICIGTQGSVEHLVPARTLEMHAVVRPRWKVATTCRLRGSYDRLPQVAV